MVSSMVSADNNTADPACFGLHCLNYNKLWCGMNVMYASYLVIAPLCHIQIVRRCLIISKIFG
jgi:hypothetical protein